MVLTNELLPLLSLQFQGSTSGCEEELGTQLIDSAENKREYTNSTKQIVQDEKQNLEASAVPNLYSIADGPAKMDTGMIDLNMKPHRLHDQASNNQVGLLFLANIILNSACRIYFLYLIHDKLSVSYNWMHNFGNI